MGTVVDDFCNARIPVYVEGPAGILGASSSIDGAQRYLRHHLAPAIDAPAARSKAATWYDENLCSPSRAAFGGCDNRFPPEFDRVAEERNDMTARGKK